MIAANVRGERARRHLRQTDLADMLASQRSSVGHRESGRRAVRAADLRALCRVLDVDLPSCWTAPTPELSAGFEMESNNDV